MRLAWLLAFLAALVATQWSWAQTNDPYGDNYDWTDIWGFEVGQEADATEWEAPEEGLEGFVTADQTAQKYTIWWQHPDEGKEGVPEWIAAPNFSVVFSDLRTLMGHPLDGSDPKLRFWRFLTEEDIAKCSYCRKGESVYVAELRQIWLSDDATKEEAVELAMIYLQMNNQKLTRAQTRSGFATGERQFFMGMMKTERPSTYWSTVHP